MIKLRKLQATDLELRVAWMNRPEVYETMHFVPPISIEGTKDWFEKNKRTSNRIDVAFEEDNSKIVAMGGLTAIDYSLRKAELYVFVDPDSQRRGYGTRTTYLLCKYAFDVLQLNKVYLYTNDSNIGARRTYEKVGFILEGRMRSERIDDGQYEDRLYYGLLASDFDKDRMPLCFSGGNIIMSNIRVEGQPLHVIRDDLFPDTGGGGEIPKSPVL